MFQNQSYKQKLSFTKNDNIEQVVVVNIVLNTNHEIEKDIISDIETVVSGMFLSNYTETEELVKEQKEETLRLKEEQQDEKARAKHAREILKENKKLKREYEKKQQDYDKNNKKDTGTKSRSWVSKRQN